ncbi:hypothetical protein BET03_04185 [Thermohalobacter berrensis]|uniref:Accessory regulator AgrB n=2 Tax=Thermohalobacter berrensis TaxID=99594 RepID=A0A419SZ67_9FIRM|nr:hypothetical protein BET03_04185 [Thermohalobacter berrensis]
MGRLAEIISKSIKENNPNLDRIQILKIRYGLECLLNELSKIIIYIFIFAFFDLLEHFFVALLFFCIIRAFSGGYHANTYWGCFFLTLGIFSTSILLGVSFSLPMYFKVFVIAISIIIAAILAPVDHPNKPILSAKRRKILKYVSIIVVISLWSISFLLPKLLSNIAIITILLQTLTLPLGKILNKETVQS